VQLVVVVAFCGGPAARVAQAARSAKFSAKWTKNGTEKLLSSLLEICARSAKFRPGRLADR
jgi:hypothetical protein